MDMRARTGHPILDVIADRWSPHAYEPRPVPPADLRSLFEAARWAPSSYNEQPWRFVAVTRDDEAAFGRALACLVDANRAWAQDAGALFFAVAARSFARNGKPNGKALYDLGQAVAMLSIEAATRGLTVHQMGGIDPEAARAAFRVPGEYDVITAVAVGYAAAPNAGGAGARRRRDLAGTVFGAAWGEPARFLCARGSDNVD
ncbi:nitroreductase family protein [bacterium]|nr:nitroreductase family protein [bacterium]MBU1072203.1 nitroreductase family protein [bacterium]MBU1675821.1 nitroreductase family protein [bacterium]